MKLYGYWRSSTSYRVRIALNLKGLAYDTVPVNLLQSEQKGDAYRKVNTQGRVPTLIDGSAAITQSIAIMEYIEEKYPSPALLPQNPEARAQVRALSLAIAADISPLGNLGVMKHLESEYGLDETQRTKWLHHWMAQGFTTVERMLIESPFTGSYCVGASPTMADCCLVPQLYNSKRYGLDLSHYPTLVRIAEKCEQHPAFIAAQPNKQPDAV